MEKIREIKITVYVDTNKVTYLKSFDDIDDAKKFLEELLERIRNY